MKRAVEEAAHFYLGKESTPLSGARAFPSGCDRAQFSRVNTAPVITPTSGPSPTLAPRAIHKVSPWEAKDVLPDPDMMLREYHQLRG